MQVNHSAVTQHFKIMENVELATSSLETDIHYGLKSIFIK